MSAHQDLTGGPTPDGSQLIPLLERFISLHAKAWITDTTWQGSDKGLSDTWEKSYQAEKALRLAIDSLERRLQEAQECDAALRRYHWLADKVIAPDYGDNDSDPHQKGYFIRHCKGPEVIYGESLDAAIDAAIGEKKGKP